MKAKTTVKFKIGDIVILKSGGPKMTVCEVHYNDRTQETSFRTSWFAGSKNERGVFPQETLEFPPPEPDKKTK